MNAISARAIFRSLPKFLQNIGYFVVQIDRYIPFTASYKHRRWVHDVYWRFGQVERLGIFLSIARFCHINRPTQGYYFEFGCHEANTMRKAWDNFHHLFDFDYVAFDSFEGLPEIEGIDKQKIWRKGHLKTEVEVFKKIMQKHGMPADKLITVKGFYGDSLTNKLKLRLLPQKAAVVYIDCDLYLSTVPVLDFVADFLQVGTIIVFDDWNCFHGDPEKGERLAFSEFRSKHPDLMFEDFVSTNEAKAFIFVGWRR